MRTKDLKIASEDAQEVFRGLREPMWNICVSTMARNHILAADAVKRKEQEYELNSQKKQ